MSLSVSQSLLLLPAFLISLSLTSSAHAFSVVAKCQPEDYVVGTADPATGEVVGFGAAGTYTPRCLKVARGTKVTIQASRIHPLQGMPDVGQTVNVFRLESGGSAIPVTQVLTEPGFYGYFCTAHGDETGRGMAGAVWVE